MTSTYRASSTGYCTGWGDPHFVTFDGLYYSYQGNCTYVLVEEIISNVDNFGVYIDNYHCDVNDQVSCPRTLIVRHETQEVQIKTVHMMPIEVQVCGWGWLGIHSVSLTALYCRPQATEDQAAGPLDQPGAMAHVGPPWCHVSPSHGLSK